MRLDHDIQIESLYAFNTFYIGVQAVAVYVLIVYNIRITISAEVCLRY